MSNTKVFPMILSGGTGSRLWPLSRSKYPKQFLKLTSEKTMLQETALRIKNANAPILICNESHRFIVAEQLLQIDISPSAILLEPAAKNTAPAIALGAFKALALDKDAVIIVLPADHIVKDVDSFQQAVDEAVDEASHNNKIVTFGIVPSRPDTGFGYIKAADNCKLSEIQEFVEKPDIVKAKQYVKSGNYYWNSGIFVMKAEVYLAELEKYEKAIYQQVKHSFTNATEDLDFIRVNKEDFDLSPENSIDYAVMEKTEKGVVLPIDVGWDDIGSFSALWQVLDKDESGNVSMGDVKNIDSSNCLVQSENQFVATIGVHDLVVIGTKDSVLVASKDRMQDVKQIVSYLKSTNRSEHLFHREVHRPWGKYDSIDNGNRYQVKRVTVKPGASLSKQMHHHRSEHWIIVSGTAIVEIEDKESLLSENQSLYIPIGTKHRLTNPGKVNLELIEVQSGSYLGEDDIVRFDDIYGRD